MTAKSDEEIYAEKSYLRALARKNGRVSKPKEISPVLEYLPEDDAVVNKPAVVTKRNRRKRQS